MDILLIEDDTIEIMKLERTIAKMATKHHIISCKNGEEALAHLESGGDLPDIILLDLNMPRMNGIEFLGILKANERLKFLPSVILTTSENRSDLLKCYELGIAGYIIKPLKYEEYESKLNKVLEYWHINELFKA